MTLGRRRSGSVALLLLLLTSLAWSAHGRLEAVTERVASAFGPDRTEWATASPEEEGFDGDRIEALGRELARRGASSLLVVRGNRIVYEWYAADHDPGSRFATAALAKSVVGSVALALAITDGRISLSDPAHRYLPAWRTDSLRSRITVRDLAFHTSGIEEVRFTDGKAGRLKGWKQQYYDHPARRFELAVTRARVLFDPGTEVDYSGVGFYALADVLERAVDRDLEAYLRERVYEPLGIPPSEWRISYGKGFTEGNHTLYALGSGGRFSTRAMARIGQLLLNGGCWQGEALLSPDAVDELLARGDASTRRWVEGLSQASREVPGGGWWLNRRRMLPGVPRDAFVGLGAGYQTLLVVPSLDLVAVATDLKAPSGASHNVSHFEAVARAYFQPLLQAVLSGSLRSVDRATTRGSRGCGTLDDGPKEVGRDEG